MQKAVPIGFSLWLEALGSANIYVFQCRNIMRLNLFQNFFTLLFQFFVIFIKSFWQCLFIQSFMWILLKHYFNFLHNTKVCPKSLLIRLLLCWSFLVLLLIRICISWTKLFKKLLIVKIFVLFRLQYKLILFFYNTLIYSSVVPVAMILLLFLRSICFSEIVFLWSTLTY